jgi:signal transduction histidine kinase
MAEVLQAGTSAISATVWLRQADKLIPTANSPASTTPPAPAFLPLDYLTSSPATNPFVQIQHQGELLGALSLEKRKGESLSPLEAKLLADLAHQAGLVLKNVGLSAQLRLRLAELQTSRQRVVQAQDDERRRLERNLHDGAQQYLVAIKVKLGLAQIQLAKDKVQAAHTITQLKADADEALENLRDLARGIYPPLLASQGLAVALQSHARKATLPVNIVAPDFARYSPELEATVYFCVLEALQNTQKYAKASHANVELRGSKTELQFEVADDGQGFVAGVTSRGAGLTNMEDRLDALGGTFQLNSTPGRGTVLQGTLPVAQTA